MEGQGRKGRGSRLRDALLKLAHSNLLLALNGVGFAASVLLVARLPLDPIALLLPFCSVFFVYTYDKLGSWDPQDAHNDPCRTAFLERRRKPLLAGASAALVMGGVLAAGRGGLTFLLYAAPVLLGLVYAVPLLPRGCRYRRLKDVTGMKSAIVVLAWCCGAALAPVAAVGGDFSPAAWIAAAWVGLRLFINTVYFDLGDLAGDRRAGVETLPVALGFRRTLVMLHWVNAAAALLVLGGVLLGRLPPHALPLLLTTLYGLSYLLRARDPQSCLGFLCDVVVDGEGIVAGGLALVGAALLGR